MDLPGRDAASRNRLVVLSTRSGRYFADLIAPRIGASTVEVVRECFGDGEQYYRVDVRERSELVGADAVLVTATSTDADLIELYRVGCELAALGTRRRILVIPYLGYSTMERAVRPGEVVTAKANARLLSSIPNSGLGNVLLLCDLHVAGLLQYFEGQCQRLELYADKVLTEAIRREIDFSGGDVVLGSADLGRPLWVQSFASKFGTGIVFVRKTRKMGETSVVGTPIGDVAGKRVVIHDDMVRSAATLINAARAYLENGAKDVFAVLSHLALNDESVVRLLAESPIVKVISTNTHPKSQLASVKACPKFVICDVSPAFAEAIAGCSPHD